MANLETYEIFALRYAQKADRSRQENFLEPFAICWSPDELMSSYERFAQLADSQDHVIPGHDPLVRLLSPQVSSDLASNVVRLDASPNKLLKDVFR